MSTIDLNEAAEFDIAEKLTRLLAGIVQRENWIRSYLEAAHATADSLADVENLQASVGHAQ